MSLPEDQDELSLSIEILSCRDLLIADRKSSDPYVKVTLGDKDLHKTKHILKTLNPVFGPDLNLENQFTANINYGELKSKGGLTFEVKDWDRIGSNDVIGLLTVSPEKLMELAAASSGSSEATELQLQTPPKRKEPNAGFITIRVVQQDAAGAGAGAGSSGSTTPASSISIHSGEVPFFPPSPPSQTSQSKEAPLSLVVEEKAPPSTSKELLIEIVSCREIPAADKNGTSDPYVKIKLGGKEVHKTSHIEKTLNPAFSSTHKNLYIIKCSAKELYAKEGIELVVKDYDKGLGALGFGSDDLGSVKVSGAQLYNAPEDQDMELPLIPYKKKDGTSASPTAGFITIRVREATLGDKDAIKEQNSFFSNVKSKILTSPRQEIKKGVSGIKFVDMDEKILLVEILSCRDLLAADKDGSSDPYVKAKMGSKDLHKTDYVNKTLNPVFGEKQNNAFVIDCSISELFGADGIFIKVKDWDRGVGGNDDLGSLQITAESLYECQEQEYHLDSPPGKMEDAGYITIRTTEIDEDQRADLRKGILPFGKPSFPGVFSSKSKTRSGPSDLSLLVEVVSCLDLRAGVGLDLSADPYVKVLMGKEVVHKTGHVSNNQSPIYSIATKSVFVLDVMKEEFIDAKEGLTFKVFDWDPLKDDELGQVTVAAEELVKGDGERMVLKLISPEKSKGNNPAAMLGSAVGAFGKVGVGAVGAVGKVGGSAFGAVGKGVGKVGDTTIGKGVGGAMSSIGKVGAKVTKPVSSVAKAGGGAVVSGVKASGNAVVSVGKAGGSAVSKFNPLASKRVDDDFGVITIRCRPATSYDKKFLKFAAEQKGDFLGCRQNMEFIFETKGGVTRLPGSKLSMKEKSGPDTGIEKFLVRPESDPDRMAVTKYLSKESIQAEAVKPSRQWLNMSSGNTGRLFVEVIGSDGLANMERFHGKTDAFAIVVFEDGYGRTDTIDDCLSPRWMPWSRRAFVFNIGHPSSDLRVGIFDNDKMWNHDLIGRVTVPVSQLRPNTEYMLNYNLYEDSVTPEREAKGTVTLRLRVEFGSAKQVVMSNLTPPTDQFINFQAAQHLTLARKVVEGKTDMVSYSIGTLTMHIAELTSYQYVSYYIVDAINSLLFWRGQVPILGIKIPVHSMIAFYAAITFVESPTLGFSYFWFGNAWLLLAIQSWRNTTPNAWNRITPFARILMMMILDKAASPEAIPANFQEKEAKDFEEHMVERIKKAEEDYEANNKMWADYQAETADLDQVGETDISTKKSNLADLASPFKGILYPIQQLLYTICFYLRVVRNVYLWDEPYYAALLAAGSIVIGIVFYILPWAFLLRWTGRIIAWAVFGPHMKLFDIFYYSKQKAATDEEEAKKLSEYYKSLKEAAQKNVELARIRTEEAVKQKAVKQILFGPYVERVPVIKSERFIDLPLHSSYAKVYVPPTDYKAKIEYIGGQGLVGTMIPELIYIKNQKDEKAKKDAEEAAKTSTPKQAAEAKIKRV